MEKTFKGRLIAASSGESADILYGSGFNAPDEFIYVETPAVKGAVVSVLEYSRARSEAKKGVTVFDRAEIMKTLGSDEKRDIFIALGRFFNVNEWTVPARFPVAYADVMRANGITVNVCHGEFFPERSVKNSDEIEKIAESMRVTEEAMRLVRDTIANAGVNQRGELVSANGDILTCEKIRLDVETFFKSRGFSAERTIIACGADSAAPHNIGSGAVMRSCPVVADIFPRSDASGYWGDMTRTFCKGKAPAVLKRAYDAVLKASETAQAHIRPGVPAILVHQLAAKTMEEAGFRTGRDKESNPCGFIHSLGHGVGLEIHENPRVSPANTDPLEEGNVISNEPGLYYPDWGGVRLEDLLVVTKDGCRNFCTMEKVLEID